MFEVSDSQLKDQKGLGFISILVGLAVAAVVGIVSYFVFYPTITKFGSSFLNSFLSIISRQQVIPSDWHYPWETTTARRPTPTPTPDIVLKPSTEEFPAWVPLYPNASLVYGGSPPPAYTREGEMLQWPKEAEMEIWVYKISSQNVTSEVSNFYRRNLSAAGWTTMTDDPNDQGETNLIVQKGYKSLIIGVGYDVPADFSDELMTNVVIIFPSNLRSLP